MILKGFQDYFIGESQMAESGGFEPPRACTQHAFQACALNRSATTPRLKDV